MSLDKIIEAHSAYTSTAAMLEALRLERARAIREAIKAGASQTDIAKATGLTRGRISQLLGE